MSPPIFQRFLTSLGRLRPGVDAAIFWTLVIGYCTWLLSTVHDLGYARDEGFYFHAADTYLKWFKILVENPTLALEQTTVDRYWRVNNEHPALIKSLFALSRALFFDRLGWFEAPGTSYRFVGMTLSSLAVGTVYLWGARAHSRGAGIVAALSFALIPRIFYHAHLDCFDMPVAAMWLITTYVYWRSLEKKSLFWVLTSGVLYGLLLNTKHNSWLLPFALVTHLALTQGGEVLAGFKQRRLRVPSALFAMATIGPALFYLTWPWIWFDTVERFSAYVRFHTAHVYYNMEFLGRTYFEPPFPRGYAWLMSFATVPLVTWVLFAVGLGGFLQRTLRERVNPWLARVKTLGLRTALVSSGEAEGRWRYSTELLWLLCIVLSYAPWFSSSTPIFGGTKHWITAYPFIALFAGVAFAALWKAVESHLESSRFVRVQWLGQPVLALSVLVAPFAMTLHSHPWGLSTYTPVVGGAAGGATLGLNRSFWGYTTGAVSEFVNQAAPKNARVFVHDTALQSWQMMQNDGTLRKDLRPQLGVAGSQLGVYHHEQHMARVEHQIWVDYGSVRPSHVGAFDGVPVIWIYERPR